MRKGVKQFLFYPAIVGIAYWLTDGLIIFPFFSSIKAWIIAKTICLPLISVVTLIAIIQTSEQSISPIISGFSSPAWVWLLSVFYFAVLTAISGKGVELHGLGSMLLLFPFTAIEVSTYSGGLGGLVLASISLPIAAIIISKMKGSSNTRFGPTGSKPSTV